MAPDRRERGWLGQGERSCHCRKAGGGGGRCDSRSLRSAKPGRTRLRCRDAAPSAGARLPAPCVALLAEGSSLLPQPSRRAPQHQPPLVALRPPQGGSLGTRSRTDHRPPAHRQTSFFLNPGPRWLAGSFPARLSRSRVCRRPRPARRASSLPLCNPEPREPSGPRASAPTKPAAQRRPGQGLGVAVGAPESGEGTGGPGECSLKGQRGRGGQRKGKKVSCSRRERLAFSARPRSLCSPCPSASACPGGSWQGLRRRQRGLSGLTGEPLPYLCPE